VERTGMRVTGGELVGRVLRAPAKGLRPTSDRVRESVFARLDVSGAAVLDLYAGSGALGIEAYSRGAASVVFVEQAPRCVAAVRANIAALGIASETRVMAEDVLQGLERLSAAGRAFDLVLLDPPYASGEAARALEALVEGSIVEKAGLVVLEAGGRHALPTVAGLDLLDERRYGDTVVARFTAS
jgi:16S rRNA (guanine966-N2)-methyltransferase